MTPDLLATPFGIALKPTLENLYPKPVPGQKFEARPDMRNLLQAIAQHALPVVTASQQPEVLPKPTQGPVQKCADLATLEYLTKSHKAVVALFTATNDERCQMAESALEDLAKERSGSDVAFAKVDSDEVVRNAAGEGFDITLRPTLVFFANGKKVCGPCGK